MSSEPVDRPPKAPLLWTCIALLLLGGVLFRVFCGFYTIQPIGALPEGRTLVVWRASGEPFFNSPDATCIERVGGVSLLCRALALGAGPMDRIIVRLPYMRPAYMASTGGQEFVSPRMP